MGQTLHRNRKPNTRRFPWLAVPAVLLAVLLALGAVYWGLRLPVDEPLSSSDPESTVTTTVVGRTLPQSFIDRNTASPHIILGDTSGRIYYSKKADERCYPASLTKLMTAIVAVENCPADTVFTVGNEVYMIAADSSRAYLSVGSRLTLEQLLKAMLLPSGNDAAYVVAVQVGRLLAQDPDLDRQAAADRFCEEMNRKATQLGCTGTHFVNPDGIHADNHYTTAADMLKIALSALKYQPITAVVSQPQTTVTFVSGQTVTWNNSNKLLNTNSVHYYSYATGLKTGSTDEAGYCLAASASRNGQTSVVIVMGASTDSGRFEDARGLLDLSFQ